jgi:hypothetical protein
MGCFDGLWGFHGLGSFRPLWRLYWLGSFDSFRTFQGLRSLHPLWGLYCLGCFDTSADSTAFGAELADSGSILLIVASMDEILAPEILASLILGN